MKIEDFTHTNKRNKLKYEPHIGLGSVCKATPWGRIVKHRVVQRVLIRHLKGVTLNVTLYGSDEVNVMLQ